MTALLGVFAKHWTPGRVKTRLAQSLGDHVAAAIHRAFVQTLLDRFSAVGDERILAFDPVECEADFRGAAGAPWQLLPQAAGNLGRRMAAFFAAALAQAERVVLIGSDSPDLPARFVADAFAALSTAEVVLGPTRDGGYYIVGARGCVPPIFDGIDWSTPHVWQQTVAHLRQAGCRWRELPQWYDVDTRQDLAELVANLGRQQADPHLAALTQRLAAWHSSHPA